MKNDVEQSMYIYIIYIILTHRKIKINIAMASMLQTAAMATTHYLFHPIPIFVSNSHWGLKLATTGFFHPLF